MKKNRKGWSEVPDEVARRKVGHTMRDGRTKRPLEAIDPSVVEEIRPLLSDDIIKAASQMSSLNQQDAQSTFGEEEADILIKLLSWAPSPSRDDSSGDAMVPTEPSANTNTNTTSSETN